jgi:hypothetical protein
MEGGGRHKRSSEAKSPKKEENEGRREREFVRQDSAEGQRREREVAPKDSAEGPRRGRDASHKESEGGEGRPRSRSRTRRIESSRDVQRGSSRSRSRARRTTSRPSDLSKMSKSFSALRSGEDRKDEPDTTSGRTNIQRRSHRNLAKSKSDRKLTKSRSDRNVTRNKVRSGESKKAPPTEEEELDNALAAYMSRSQIGSEAGSLHDAQGDVADVAVLQFDPTVRHNVAIISPKAPAKPNPAVASSITPDGCTHQDLEDVEDKASQKKHRRRSSINVKLPLWGKK